MSVIQEELQVVGGQDDQEQHEETAQQMRQECHGAHGPDQAGAPGGQAGALAAWEVVLEVECLGLATGSNGLDAQEANLAGEGEVLIVPEIMWEPLGAIQVDQGAFLADLVVEDLGTPG